MKQENTLRGLFISFRQGLKRERMDLGNPFLLKNPSLAVNC